MESRRKVLNPLMPQPSTHAGLWLDRFARTLAKKDGGTARDLIEEIRKIRVPDDYPQHYSRWKASLDGLLDGVLAPAVVLSRMVVGLGAESVLETSIALHRTYGVPVIPGSALKGLASAAAHRLLADEAWRKATKRGVDGSEPTEAGESHLAMFGDTTTAGYVTFHDALWDPEGATTLPLDLDVMTVHHRDYYGGKNEPPADWDSPVPVSFVTARGKYLVAVSGPTAWRDKAMSMLKIALAEEGIGAKTAAGYGRMSLDYESQEEHEAREAVARQEREAREALARREREEREIQRQAALERRIKGLQKDTAGNEVPALLREATDEERRAVAQRIEQELRTKFKGWLASKADKAWVKELLEAAGQSV